jgi:CBS domain containing-hemolysin-like protein
MVLPAKMPPQETVVPKQTLALGLALALAASPARASFLSGEALDTMADILAIVVLFLVPAVGIVVFWIVHVLPEKIAEKRHHPQTAAITTLCLLSLVFGGLLWPLAWLWAFTKPVMHRAAYGTDKHDDYYDEMAGKQQAGELTDEQRRHLLEDLAAIQAKGPLPPSLKGLQERLNGEAGKRQAA